MTAFTREQTGVGIGCLQFAVDPAKPGGLVAWPTTNDFTEFDVSATPPTPMTNRLGVRLDAVTDLAFSTDGTRAFVVSRSALAELRTAEWVEDGVFYQAPGDWLTAAASTDASGGLVALGRFGGSSRPYLELFKAGAPTPIAIWPPG